MDGISAYTHISQGCQQPGLSPRQQPLDGARAERGVERTSQGTENHPEKPSSIQDKVTLSAEAQQKLHELSARDQEVRTHEAAHAAVGAAQGDKQTRQAAQAAQEKRDGPGRAGQALVAGQDRGTDCRLQRTRGAPGWQGAGGASKLQGGALGG